MYLCVHLATKNLAYVVLLLVNKAVHHKNEPTVKLRRWKGVPKLSPVCSVPIANYSQNSRALEAYVKMIYCITVHCGGVDWKAE